ncbi:unnamed protein product [Ilex paraguariensis]|uniref:F-box associated beta-propeller type 3 domain-containing protein n=1 Tax=Ilex paraguariensis TaxID=185542 RepID=A0ABC8RQ11_9AQUA
MHVNQSIETNSNLNLILRDSPPYSVDFDSLDNVATAKELNHPLKCDEFGTEVLGSCNGLLCLSNTEEDIVLWNLKTRKSWKLPIAPIEFSKDFWCCQYINYGFGYDFVHDDYKLVRMILLVLKLRSIV